ncbi:hypothetical protein HK107_01000 [Parvularcula sp. ZS-1/3]|uniref:Uncharacterized protein n=1 Tax=Parvularcula mediterranea TaxID=2732508 RepID=A0A7Y3RIW0_9PROT|nr:hypothetical protein [Parvularcula mediterranea]NNU14899.1 hypothetical protein [Parvularcula mediterranea]
MKALAILFLIVFLACLAFVGSLLFLTRGAHQTTLDVRLLGFGETPLQCVDRVRKNFEAIRPEMNEVAEIFEDNPSLVSAGIFGGGETEEDVFVDQNAPEDSSNTQLKAKFLRPLLALERSGVAIRPFSFNRRSDGGELTGVTMATCGLTSLQWWDFVLSLLYGGRAARPLGSVQPTATTLFERGNLGSDDPRERCGEAPPTLNEEFFGTCVSDLGGGWIVRQEWADWCSRMNLGGWERHLRETYLDPETRREWEQARDEGRTPCGVIPF